MKPTPGDVHVNVPLTNISVAYVQAAENFVADRVFPLVPSDQQSNLYYVWNKSDFNRAEMLRRAPGAPAASMGIGLTTQSFAADVWAVNFPIADQLRANADSVLSLDSAATEALSLQALIRKEVQFVSRAMATGIWSRDITGVASAPSTNQVLQWNNASATPIQDVRAGKQFILSQTGRMPNKLTMSRQVWDTLVDHPTILNRVVNGQTPGGPATVTKAMVAAILELEEILVMDGIQESGIEGGTSSMGFIAPKAALLTFTPSTPSLITPAAGYTFFWSGYTGAQANGSRVKRYREERQAADIIEIEAAFDQRVVAADCGYYFTSIIA